MFEHILPMGFVKFITLKACAWIWWCCLPENCELYDMIQSSLCRPSQKKYEKEKKLKFMSKT